MSALADLSEKDRSVVVRNLETASRAGEASPGGASSTRAVGVAGQ